MRYWLTPAPDERFDEKVDDINSLYQQSQKLAQKGEIVMSIDEMTAVQALERKHPGLPMSPGKVERRESEYIRHGTQSFIVSFGWPVDELTPFLAGIRAMKKTLYRISRRWLKALLPHHAGTLSPTTSISINQSPS